MGWSSGGSAYRSAGRRLKMRERMHGQSIDERGFDLEQAPAPAGLGPLERKPRVLVACEFTGRVRDALIANGCDAMSCDLEPTDVPGPHYQGDVRDVLGGIDGQGWDALIAFPPCTYLAYSGARWWKHRLAEQAEALAFVELLWDSGIPRIAIENPNGKVVSLLGRATQIIEPHHYGHGETKCTLLWLHNLPTLQPTNRVPGRVPRINQLGRSKHRTKIRSETYPGVAEAIGAQWAPAIRHGWQPGQQHWQHTVRQRTDLVRAPAGSGSHD